MPWKPSPARNRLRFESGCPRLPSVPMKLSSEPQIDTSRSASDSLATTKRSTANGMPLASASPGIRGLNASIRTAAGTAGSDRQTWPNG